MSESIVNIKWSTWRLIPLMEASGRLQMAIDRWLLESHRQGKQPSTLRFYTWQPAAISLGYHQQNYPANWQQLSWKNNPLEIVRRPTGGRAVLHQGDLTYALVTNGIAGTRLSVYKYLCQFLILGWQSLGVELQYGLSDREYSEQHNCFATATSADLITNKGVKLIGSAQLRRRKTILQHGSMQLTTDRQLFTQIFGESNFSNFQESIEPNTNINLNIIIQALTQAAVTCFKINLVEEPLSDAELQDIFTNFV
jgi:lipoate-protein ligase A